MTFLSSFYMFILRGTKAYIFFCTSLHFKVYLLNAWQGELLKIMAGQLNRPEELASMTMSEF